MIKRIVLVFFVLGFIYIVIPGPSKIEDFPPLPNSLKSTLEGDTIQNPNIAAYYSDFTRKDITKFYLKFYQRSNWLPAIRLNHPPERAYQYVRDQQESTFLEEYLYPFKASFFVNGYEPKVENDMRNVPSRFLGDHIRLKDRYYVSKATIRYYPTPLGSRIFVYFLIWVCIYLSYIVSKRVFSQK